MGAEFATILVIAFVALASTVDAARVRDDAILIVFAGAVKSDGDVTSLEEIQG